MLEVKIFDEMAPLELVVLGTAEHFGGVPVIEDTHDPKSKEHILAGTYPKEADLILETDQFRDVLEKYDIKVLRPQVIDHLNQIFTRDIGIAIDDRFIIPKVTHNRRKEVDGFRSIIDQIDPNKLLQPGVDIRMEGGDVMPWNGKIFVGYSQKADWDEYIVARTNEAGVEYLVNNFPDWEIVPFELKKSDVDARENALHLDCCFQPLGKGKAIVHKNGFKNSKDVDYIIDLFGVENLHFIDKDEMYDMNNNILSISPEVVVSDKSFVRLNNSLKDWGFTVEEIAYHEVAKMEGLMRCSTMPLRRSYE